MSAFWKLIDATLPTTQPILGGWLTRGEWRYGVCHYDGAVGWLSERGAIPSHYVTVIPIDVLLLPPQEPDPRDTTRDDLDPPVPDTDGGTTDWNGDPAGPPLV